MLHTDRLRKILETEKKRGYDDKAVIGGLDKFVANWGLEAHRMIGHPMFRSSLRRLGIISPTYAAMTKEQRAEWLEQVLKWSNNLEIFANAMPGSAGKIEPLPRPPTPAPRTAQSPSQASVKAPPSKAATPPTAPKPFVRREAPLLAPGQGLETPLEQVWGVRSDIQPLLKRLGVETVRDLLYYFPRRHIDFSATVPVRSLIVGQEQTVLGTVTASKQIMFGKTRRRAAEIHLSDETGNIRAIFFNQPYVAQTLRVDMSIALAGRVALFDGRKVFENPEYEIIRDRELVHTARLAPVYPLTQGLYSRTMRTLMKRTVDQCVGLLEEFLPIDLRRRRSLLTLPPAIKQAHFPDDEASKDASRRRLAFDEFLLLQLGVLARKREWKQALPGHPLRADPALLDAYYGALPFSLTGAQRRCVQEITSDIAKSTPMSRLLQGEVGSGKTAVALAAMLVAVANGQQVAMMAPTEVLAEQHFRTLRRLLQPDAVGYEGDVLKVTAPGLANTLTIALLIGGMSRKRKEEVRALAARGEVDIVVGTHALFQKDVEFGSLGLVVVDEQHRFGVMQRQELRQKGFNPHLLVMTATPIPRSLALTLYGDLDLSVIDEMPKGRQTIRTKRLDAMERQKAYNLIRKEVREGRQAFIIYPLIEESEKLEAAAAKQAHERLTRDVFSDLRVGLLHGRMKAAEKDAAMRAFREREWDILVSTAVVEVGIDVPNATVMMIESAERFGLAQLHQFRGRVGRGEHESYCILVSESPSPEASERLRLMEQLHDGFKLAEEDLRLRGQGEVFGTRQSGLPDLRMASLSDTDLLDEAQQEAEALFAQDATLALPEHVELAKAVARAWRHRVASPGEA
ncbi:MAG: ATP-dependent DNA helicase RecG [Chloroflexi bacterium]|nr:ATP-dependent DNA helicase RecG [Chloroflexota bacterium]